NSDAASEGGGIYIEKGGLAIDGKATFRSNAAGASGGAIAIWGRSFNTSGETSFFDNRAPSAGAINAFESDVFLDGLVTFSNNQAMFSGG
ncbi:unnamed protein product, partial [Scytosiphon promiscuus]